MVLERFESYLVGGLVAVVRTDEELMEGGMDCSYTAAIETCFRLMKRALIG